jgi:hypothetical protein
MATTDIWSYRVEIDTFEAPDITGFEVEATDGSIGKVDDATTEARTGFIVVDTGPWIFGKKVVLPAGVIERVDMEDGKVHVDRTKDEIKNAPEFDETRFGDPAYRDQFGGYYTTSAARRFDEPL